MTIDCPACGAAVEPIAIVYGYPTPETFEAAERGKLKLGGCIVGPDQPEAVCPSCSAAIGDSLAPSRQSSDLQ